jgi:hypothetical protein
MLSSSLNTPTATGLLSSEPLNVVTSSSHSADVAESVNESELDWEDDDDDSDNDFQIVGEQSGTEDSTDASSSGPGPKRRSKRPRGS